MKISVIIPVYNAERYIRMTLDSAFAAAARLAPGDEAEIIAIDDGSTDASPQILNTYTQPHNLRVFHKPNGGVSSARNLGMEEATGDWLLFLDSDDTIHVEGLVLILSVIRKTGADLLRFGWRAVQRQEVSDESLPDATCAHMIEVSALRESTIRFCALGCATAVSATLCSGLRWSDLTQGEDLVFVLDCMLRSKKTVYINAPVLNYLTHADSASHGVSPGIVIGTCRYLPEVVARCQSLGESAAAASDTRRYVLELVCRRLFRAWRLFDAPEVRSSVRTEFWRLICRLAERQGFLPQYLRAAFARAARSESEYLFGLMVARPYRVLRRFI